MINPTLRRTGTSDLSEAALSLETNFSGRFMLSQVLLSASVNITETVTVTFISKDGTTYDVILDTSNLSSAKNYVFRPTGRLICEAGDKIKVTCTKANNTGSVYATIIAEDLGKN